MTKNTWTIILPNKVIRNKDTLAARGLEEHVRVSLIFAIIVSFMKAVFTLVYVRD